MQLSNQRSSMARPRQTSSPSPRQQRRKYFGYHAPCPPWSERIVHNYSFTLYTLDIARCPVSELFTGADVHAAMAAPIVADARLAARYSLNPDVPA